MRTYLGNGNKIMSAENKSYSVIKKMGEGASCIAYYGIDDQTGAKCIIKEYYPINVPILRDSTGYLACEKCETAKFNKGKARFDAAIERQVKLRNNCSTTNQIFYVLDRFEANGTSYVIVPQYSGHTYSDNSTIDLYDRIKICKSVAEYVSKCHDEGYLCLDIKPDNIFILPETSELAMFFDFDSVCRIDEVAQGENLSYTNLWAAPEQVVPGSYSKISAASDIFVLGELIYWSVFDCHSVPHEYRGHSRFEYSKSQFESLLTNDAEKILTDIFHHTLRSSVKNRYKSVAELMQQMSKLLLELYPGKESITSIFPATASCFIGRETELNQVNSKLAENGMAILTGVGGIGKSEIAKRYVEKYSSLYETVIYLTYSFDLLSTINGASFLDEFEQKDEESDIHYCNRKISKLTELYSGRNLLVIDNLNIEIEELEHKDIWARICTLPCDLLITSRCNQEHYFGHQIYVDGMEEENLKKLFFNYCPYEAAQESSVVEIIKSVQCHTLVVELIAKQAYTCLKTPSEMQELLMQKGVLGLNAEDVKWGFKKRTVAEHVRGLFSVFSITEQQKQLLYIMAFMPVSGVDEKVFFEFFDLENHNDLRYLIDNGWITEQKGRARKIAVHPVIASVVMDAIRDSDNIAQVVYDSAMKSMILWSSRDDINREEFFLLCNSLALQTCEYRIGYISAADYMVRYNGCFAQYGNSDERRKLLLYAIDIYNSVYPDEEYVAVRENAYESYVASINDVEHYREVKDTCEKHLKLAKRSKDLFMASRWYLMLYYASHVKNDMSDGISLSFIIYSLKIAGLERRIRKELKKKHSKILSEEYLEKLNYRYMLKWRNSLPEKVYLSMAGCFERMSESDVFFSKENWAETYNLKNAISVRNRYKDAHTVNASTNSIMKKIDEVKLLVLSRNYGEATAVLVPVVCYFEEHQLPPNVNLYLVLSMLGAIAMAAEDYKQAASYYEKCLEIAQRLNYKKNYNIRIHLVRAYLYLGDIKRATDINYSLFVDLKEVDRDNRGTYMAEMYYNNACRYLFRENREQAQKFFQHAIAHFRSSSTNGNRKTVGIARCLYQLGVICCEENKEAAVVYFSEAYKSFQECLGDKHIETTRCKEKLDQYNQSK